MTLTSTEMAHFRKWAGLSPDDLALMLRLGMLEVTGRTGDGQVTEYRLTGKGRILCRPGSSK